MGRMGKGMVGALTPLPRPQMLPNVAMPAVWKKYIVTGIHYATGYNLLPGLLSDALLFPLFRATIKMLSQ